MYCVVYGQKPISKSFQYCSRFYFAQIIRLWFSYSRREGIYSRNNGQEITRSKIRVNCKFRHNSNNKVSLILRNAFVLGSIMKRHEEIMSQHDHDLNGIINENQCLTVRYNNKPKCIIRFRYIDVKLISKNKQLDE